MDPSTSNNSERDEERALEILLDAFSSVCSLEEIASAYCRAGCDVNIAGEILSRLQEDKSTNELDSCNGIVSIDVEPSYCGKNSKTSKQRKLTVSTGTVSTVLGKGYSCQTSSQSEPLKATKPLKLKLKEPLTDDVTSETIVSDSAPNSHLISNKETVEFLFSMLGDGFKLDKDVINNVLGSCGFDVKKTMDYLLAMPLTELDKSSAINSGTREDFTDRLPILESQHSEGKDLSSARRKSSDSYSMNKSGSDLPQEVLESLFCAPKRFEETPKRAQLQLGLNRTRVVGQKPVSAPLDDVSPRPPTDITKVVGKNVLDDNEEDSYPILRRAAKQSWDLMKRYYEAAVDAFNKGERAKADYLIEQGKYHNKMAREADENSAREILDSRNVESENDFILDLHTHDAKSGVKLLKCHLRSLAGISSYRCLKVIVDTKAKDITKGKRRKMVLGLLSKESIEWTEEKPGTICIRLDAVDPNKLSFAEA